MPEVLTDSIIEHFVEYIEDLQEYKQFDVKELENNGNFQRLIARIRGFINNTSILKEEFYKRADYFENLSKDPDFISLINNIKESIKVLCINIDIEKAEEHRFAKITENLKKIIDYIDNHAEILGSEEINLYVNDINLINDSKSYSELQNNVQNLINKINRKISDLVPPGGGWIDRNKKVQLQNIINLINFYKNDCLLLWNRMFNYKIEIDEPVFDVDRCLDYIANKFKYELHTGHPDRLYKHIYNHLDIIKYLNLFGETEIDKFAEFYNKAETDLIKLKRKTDYLERPNELFVEEFQNFKLFEYGLSHEFINPVKTTEKVLKELKKQYEKLNEHKKKEMIINEVSNITKNDLLIKKLRSFENELSLMPFNENPYQLTQNIYNLIKSEANLNKENQNRINYFINLSTRDDFNEILNQIFQYIAKLKNSISIEAVNNKQNECEKKNGGSYFLTNSLKKPKGFFEPVTLIEIYNSIDKEQNFYSIDEINHLQELDLLERTGCGIYIDQFEFIEGFFEILDLNSQEYKNIKEKLKNIVNRETNYKKIKSFIEFNKYCTEDYPDTNIANNIKQITIDVIEELIFYLSDSLNITNINYSPNNRNFLSFKTLKLCVNTGYVEHGEVKHNYNKGTDQFNLLKILIENKIKGIRGNIINIYSEIYSEEEQAKHSCDAIKPKEKITKLRDDVHKNLKMTAKHNPEIRIKINSNEIYLD